jgi:hypothetical protein
MAALITVDEGLRALQAETFAFSETNVERHKFLLEKMIINSLISNVTAPDQL